MRGVDLVKKIVDGNMLNEEIQVMSIPEDGDELDIEKYDIADVVYDNDEEVGVIKIVS